MDRRKERRNTQEQGKMKNIKWEEAQRRKRTNKMTGDKKQKQKATSNGQAALNKIGCIQPYALACAKFTVKRPLKPNTF